MFDPSNLQAQILELQNMLAPSNTTMSVNQLTR